MPATVAIVGAGAAGICAARACISAGLSVTIFDKRSTFGGIWSTEDTPVFDNLTTNTACFDTCISDFPPLRVTPKGGGIPEHDNLCLTAEEFREYLHTVVRITPGLIESFRSCTEVVAVRDIENEYEVHVARVGTNDESETSVERFNYVIVASGSFHNPSIPNIPGADKFPGTVIHVAKYKNPKQFAGKRVLVVGGSISGCEAVGDMAMGREGERPASVTLSSRIMRHLMIKQKGFHLPVAETSNRFYNLRKLAGKMWDDEYKEDLLNYVRSISKNEDYNAPPATLPVHVPGMPTWSVVHEKLLEASKSKKMQWNIGGISRINEDGTVAFNNGTEETYDVIIFATGYQLELPFLDKSTQKLVVAGQRPSRFMDLADFTFHPKLPRIAFIGLLVPGAATPPMFDMQARYIARVFANPETRLTEEELFEAQEVYRRQRTSEKAHTLVFGFEVLDRFAQLSGCEVDLSAHKEWTKAMLFGPLVPAQFRLFGEGKLENALEVFEKEMTGAGYVKGDNQVEERQLRQLREVCEILVAQGKAQKGLQEAVDYLCSENGYVGPVGE